MQISSWAANKNLYNVLFYFEWCEYISQIKPANLTTLKIGWKQIQKLMLPIECNDNTASLYDVTA